MKFIGIIQHPLLQSQGIMTDWLKLIECKYSPTEIFTLYDYTKVVYPIDSGFYIKQIVTPQQKSSFISIKHDFDRIISIHGVLNHVVAVEQKGDYYYVCFYAVTEDEMRVRISLQIQGSNLKVKSVYSDNMLMLCFSTEDGMTHQLIFLDCTQKSIIAKGLIQGQILDISSGPNSSLSIYFPKHIIAYKNQPIIDKNTMVRLYKEAQVDINVDVQKHFWIEDELFVWGKNKGYVIIKNRICQQFDGFHRLHNAAPLICGFMVCDGCVMKIFKKKSVKYELLCQIIDEHLMECTNLCFTPQQDIIAYYTPVSEALIVSCTFSEQIQQAQQNQNSTQMAITLKSKQISHVKSYDYTVYSSCQSWFAAANGTQIKLIHSNNFTQFLSIELSDQGDSGYMNSDLKPRHIAIHPNRSIFAVALKKLIKIYFVTFNEIKVLKEINVSMCGYLVFNHSGSLLTAVVSGKGGAKLYVHKINQLKSDFSLLDTITIGKKPINIEWDSLDTTLYYFYQEGYYMCSLQNKFKTRKQVVLNFKGEMVGATLSKQDRPIFWGNQNLCFANEDGTLTHQSIRQSKIKHLYVSGQQYIIIFQDGKIGKSKNIDVDQCFSKSFDLNTKGKKFELRLQQNKLIYLSEELNLKFYEFGAGYHSFIDIIGIDKKKLYTIMNKHKEYQSKIKQIRQQFTAIILEQKAKAVAEQEKLENQYKYELKDHIEREKKVKEEKAKLEQMMEQNIEIKERESINQIKQLERLYERKIALTTNKLLTEKEIGFRDRITAQAKLKILEEKHYTDIQQIRKQFAEHLKSNILDKNEAQKQMNSIKKDYETRLYELEEENQIILKQLQDKNQNSLVGLKKMVNNWENKYSEVISQKDNTEKQYQQQLLNCARLKQKISFLQVRKTESERRCENLSNQILKVQKVLEERNKTLQFYEKRIEDLQKSNQILKYRVLEVKQQNDPYEAEVSKLKQNLTDLQQQYQKILKGSYEQEQKMQILKKQKSKLKQDLEVISQKHLKLSKRHEQLLDKVRETTKSPIQQIRKELLAIVDSYARINKVYSTLQKRSDSPLGELNRIRDHLEVCLDEATTTNKKNQQQRKIQITKKNRENSELLTEINTMRKKIRQLQSQINMKNLQISRMARGETPTIMTKQQKVETTEAQSKQFMKTKSRGGESFYEKSMFRTGTHWNQKRLKTEEGGSRRKKSSLSMMRDRNQHLSIHPQAEEIEQFKRIIEQKDIFIQKLIAKIQKT